MLESVIGTSITLQSFLLCTAVSLVLGIGLAFVAGYRQKTSSSFAVTLALLPAVVQLVIMLDNAVKYARADSPITLTLEKTRRGIALRCRNGSDPIPEDTLAKLFDRFYRADPSRNAATGGFGVGLSIARSIAEAHRGSICARMAGEEVEFVAELR